MNCRNPKVEIADGEYELEKARAIENGTATRINVRMIERRLGLRPGQLLNYRANHYSRNRKTGKRDDVREASAAVGQ